MQRHDLDPTVLRRRLAAERPTPPADLVDRIAERLDGGARPRRSGLVGALALAGATLVALASVGGIERAAAASRGAVQAAVSAVTAPVRPAAAVSESAPAALASAPAPPPSAPAAAPASAPQASAGSVTICHATGSASNPYVEITVSGNALAGHGGHAGDIVPAPPGGCPGPTPGDDQYRPGKGCGDPNHVHFREGQCTP